MIRVYHNKIVRRKPTNKKSKKSTKFKSKLLISSLYISTETIGCTGECMDG